MKIVKPSIVVTFYAPEDGSSPEQAIEAAGRTCYKSEDKITTESAEKFVAYASRSWTPRNARVWIRHS